MAGNSNSGNRTERRGKPSPSSRRTVRITAENRQRVLAIMPEGDQDIELMVNLIIKQWLEDLQTL